MRASRLLSLLMLLQTRGRMTASALAETLEVSVRTIHRDIDQLSLSGVPVVVERGAKGGFALIDGWRTRLTGLTAAEAQALFLCGVPGPAAQLGMSAAVASVQLKLLSALPPNWLVEARRVSARFHVDPRGWYAAPSPTPWLAIISDAVWYQRRLQLRYESWKGIVARTVEPLGLVLKAGDWYLIGRVDASTRTFRVSNVLDAQVTGESFEPPGDFDLAAYWDASLQRFEASLYTDTATVRATARGRVGLRRLSRAVADAVDRAGGGGRGARARLVIPIESVEQAATELLRLGRDVEVLAPPALRARVARIARDVAALYSERRAASPRSRRSASSSSSPSSSRRRG